MKLWSKDKTSTAAQIEAFTVGRDRDFDLQMARFDVEGSIAHVTMLGEQGLMSKEQADLAVAELQKILIRFAHCGGDLECDFHRRAARHRLAVKCAGVCRCRQRGVAGCRCRRAGASLP